jgi:hypothetical protein
LRNAALIAAMWFFPKRPSEILNLRMNDVEWVWLDGKRKLKLIYTIMKKRKSIKFCSSCRKQARRDSVFCPYCGKQLSENDKKMIGQDPIRVTKYKRVTPNPGIPVFAMWFDERKKISEDGFLFCPLINKKGQPLQFVPNRKMSVKTFDWLLKKILPNLTPYGFRSARAKFEYMQHRDPRALMKSGDWSTIKSCEHYLNSLGLSREDEINEEI